MRIVIMQPTYLPWLGYFHLMAHADHFVLLDDVQFSRQSWQQRNRLMDKDQLIWLSVPVMTGGRTGQEILEVEVTANKPWRRKHLGTIDAVYAKAPWRAEVSALVASVLNGSEQRLAEINIALIAAIAQYLGLARPLLRASDLGCDQPRSDRLLAICRKLGGSVYLSPAGSRGYTETDGVFAAADFPVVFQNYSPPIYRNATPLYASTFPSILDALAWLGPKETRALLNQKIA